MLPSDSTNKEITRLTQEALQLFRGDAHAALTLSSQAVALARSLGESQLLSRALRARAMAHGSAGKIDAARADFAEALALARAEEEVQLEGQCLHGLSVAHFHLGDYPAALARMSEAITLHRVVDNDVGLQLSLNSLAAFQGSLGNYTEAIACLTEARELAQNDPNSTDEAIILTNIALVYVELDQAEDAIPFFEEAFVLYEKTPDQSNLCNTLLNYAGALRSVGRAAEALEAAKTAVTLAQRLEHPLLEVKTLVVLGCSQTDREQAHQTLRTALQLAQERPLPTPLAMVQQALGMHYLHQCQPKEASLWLEKALSFAQGQKQLFTQSELHKALSNACEAEGNLAGALAHQREFHTLFARLHHESANHRMRSQRAQYQAKQTQREAEELRRQALEDPLTQLYNRRYLSQYLEGEIARSRRHALPLCLILIDIDNFKLVNDNFSHQMGDQVLTTLANLLRQASRGSDILVRQSGDEFVIVAPETPLDDARLMAERLNQRVQDFPWEDLVSGLSVTISIGLADLLVDDDLLNRADQRLYDAKRAGKNRLALQEPVSAGKTTEKLNC